MTDKKGALERGYIALKELVKKGSKVNMNSVAKHAGFSHTNFRFPEFADLKDAISEAQKKQLTIKKTEEVETLRAQVTEFKAKLLEAKKLMKTAPQSDAENVNILLAKLMECYRLNDLLKSENADLRNQIAHSSGTIEQVIKVNKETGEVITGYFDKR
jgi:hypothetical protein